jgi:plastocyanin
MTHSAHIHLQYTRGDQAYCPSSPQPTSAVRGVGGERAKRLPSKEMILKPRYFRILALAFAATHLSASISFAEARCPPGSNRCSTPYEASVAGHFRTAALLDHEMIEEGAGPSTTADAPALARSDPVTVRIASFQFAPEKVTVAAGTTVTWTNFDKSPHQVSVKGKALRSGIILKGHSGSLTFTEPGTYEYLCGPHSGMKGTIEVK